MSHERVTPDQLGPAIGRALGKVRGVLVEVVAMNVAARAVRKCVELTDQEKIVDRGAYKQGFYHRRIPNGAEFGNSAPHAGVIEFGRRPGRRPPPVDVILAWLLRKKGTFSPSSIRRRRLTDVLTQGGVKRDARMSKLDVFEEQKRIAYAIARKIGKFGTKPHFIVRRVNAEVPDMIREEVGRLRGRL